MFVQLTQLALVNLKTFLSAGLVRKRLYNEVKYTTPTKFRKNVFKAVTSTR